MPTSYMEIVELQNGDFALKRADSDDAPLVTIQFSKEAKEFLKSHDVEIARAMIGAGIQAVGAISKEVVEDEPQTIH